MQTTPRQISYVLSAENVISYVDAAWVQFASENGASHLTYEAVVGQPLEKFIDGERTKSLYENFFHRLRKAGRTHQFHYRCDSPECLRVLEMFTTPLGDGRIHLESRIIFQRTRAPLSLIAPTTDRNNRTCRICSLCKKVEVNPNTWIELEQAENLMISVGGNPFPLLENNLCPECPHRLVLH